MLKKKRKSSDLIIVLIFAGIFLAAGCFFYSSMTGFSIFDFFNDLFGKKAEVYGFEFANPSSSSIIDTIFFVPSGKASGVGVDLFGATTRWGFDNALGFAFKVANEQKLKAVEFLVMQNVPGAGANALIYEGQGIRGGSDLYYWIPRYTSNPIAVLKLAQPYPDSSNTKDFQIFRFEADEPLTLKADTPYVVVFDPIATEDGQGTYILPNIASSIGFLSSVGQPEQNIFMPSYLIRRQLDVRKSYTYNHWTFTRTDRRYLVRVIAS